MTNEELENRIKELELELSTLKSAKDESSLHDKESSFYNVFFSIPIAISLSRLSDGSFVQVNEEFLKLTGYTRNEVIGLNSAELGINIDFIGRNEILLKLSLGEQVPDFEIEITRKTGEKRIGLSSLKTIDINGEHLICCSFIDITERKQLENKSHIQSSLLEQIHNALITIDFNNNILSWNKHAETLYQWTSEEAVGKNIIELLAPEEMKGVAKTNIDKLYLDGHWEGRFDVKRKDNSIIPVHIINSYLKDMSGTNIGIIGISTDISEQLNTEKVLKDNEELFREIVSNTPDHIMIQDNDLKYKFVVNPQLGLTLSDMIGKTDFDLADKDIAEKITAIKQNVLTTGEPQRIETSMLSKSGKLEYFDGTYTPKFDNSGKINGLIGYFRNVTELEEAETELRKSEEKFKLIFDKSTAPIMIADDKGNYIAVNKAASELFEYSIDEMLRMNVGDIITASNPYAAEQYEEYMKKGEETGEFGFISKNGTPKTVKYQAVRTKPDFNLSIIMDITDQKRISEELTKAKLHAEEAMNSKQQFLSNMSHEIRTPMNSIIGFTKILSKTNLDDLQKEYLHAITTSSEVLIVLINDILDLAKVDAGKMVFEKKVFKLNESIATIIYLFKHKIQEKNLELIKEYNKNIPLIVKGDSARLHQILLNLLSNAVKFTNEGRITVSVDLLDEDDEKVTIEFTVKDTGIGIPGDKLDKIFNNFEQVSNFNSGVYGGTGLGLAISKQLVEFQGGSISVKSNLGKGSAFSFILNFEKTSDAFEIEPDPVELITEIKKLNILVVEDVKLNQLLVKTMLNDFGFKYDVADNGKIAIEKLQSNTYDLILMDLMMPEMNGFDATEYIRNKMDSKIPIIALSADVTTVDLEKCKALGMNDYISKPIDEKVLFNKIVALVK
jgi:PAS domain S-box-containing protein